MIDFEKQIEMSLAQLLEDERLRSNLIDAEAKLLFDWAITRLTHSVESIAAESAALEALRAETRRVRSAMRNINDLFDGDHNPTPLEALTALNLLINQSALPPVPDRSALIQWLLAQLSGAWTNSPTNA